MTGRADGTGESDGAGGTSPARPSQRVDKWLWTARFFKTRTNAAAAVTGGKVHVDGERVKPSKRVGPGDRLEIRREPLAWEVVVQAVSANRLPAREAAALYTETEQSIARREAEAARRRAEARSRPSGLGRPTKRERRQVERLRGRGEPEP